MDADLVAVVAALERAAVRLLAVVAHAPNPARRANQTRCKPRWASSAAMLSTAKETGAAVVVVVAGRAVAIVAEEEEVEEEGMAAAAAAEVVADVDGASPCRKGASYTQRLN